MIRYERFFKKISIGSVLTIVALMAILVTHRDVLTYGEMILYETIPYYQGNTANTQLMRLNDPNNDAVEANASGDASIKAQPTDSPTEADQPQTTQDVPKEQTSQGDMTATPATDPTEDVPVVNTISEELDLVGVGDVIFQSEADNSDTTKVHSTKENLTYKNIAQFADLDYVKRNFYTIDKRTDLTAQQFNLDQLLNTNLTINNDGDGPKILIFHTHSKENYSDSNKADINDGILAVGEELKRLLETKYHIKTMHDTTSYDVVDGRTQIIGAYERMEPSVRAILKQYPSIQVVIDMHRDGVADSVHLVKTINGKQTAQFMFFNGLSKLYSGGSLNDIDNLQNPYIDTNLALSFHLQLNANELYPDLTRKIYLNAYRYSLHMLPKSLLVEVGAQTNTKQEALNAMEPLADVLAKTILNS